MDLKFAPRIIAQVELVTKDPGKHTGETKLKDIQIISIDIVWKNISLIKLKKW